ncbi:MAG: hypothetical protein GIW95_09590 [Candidatus Eremiobacteraeota bacterium]|nr:hypothetical protein [Candidatus Eremiobacteraeota bacterium]
MLVAGIFALSFAVVVVTLHPASTAVPAARAVLTAMVETARSLAASSGDGATLLIEEGEPGTTRLRLFPGRPRTGGSFDATVPPYRSATVAGPISSALGPLPLAIFIGTAGTWSAAVWSPRDGTLDAEPACTDLILAIGGSRRPGFALHCGEARIVGSGA